MFLPKQADSLLLAVCEYLGCAVSQDISVIEFQHVWKSSGKLWISVSSVLSLHSKLNTSQTHGISAMPECAQVFASGSSWTESKNPDFVR